MGQRLSPHKPTVYHDDLASTVYHDDPASIIGAEDRGLWEGYAMGALPWRRVGAKRGPCWSQGLRGAQAARRRSVVPAEGRGGRAQILASFLLAAGRKALPRRKTV